MTKSFERVTVSSEQVVKSFERVGVSSEQVTKSFERVSVSSERVTKSFERVGVSSERVTKSFERVGVSSERVTKSFEQMQIFSNGLQTVVNGILLKNRKSLEYVFPCTVTNGPSNFQNARKVKLLFKRSRINFRGARKSRTVLLECSFPKKAKCSNVHLFSESLYASYSSYSVLTISWRSLDSRKVEDGSVI